ncbi:MAG TPA: hypothetical protein VF131_04645 [Blastocatellia bacterium]|nr:hypothetical protein [Blastocatellia bacterium]
MKRDAQTDEPSADAAREILAYLSSHPNAQDTIEGIMHWWLLEQDIKRSMAHIQAALAELVARNLVVEHRGPDGKVRYRVAQPEDEENLPPADNVRQRTD